jgi:hypothetical protein
LFFTLKFSHSLPALLLKRRTDALVVVTEVEAAFAELLPNGNTQESPFFSLHLYGSLFPTHYFFDAMLCRCFFLLLYVMFRNFSRELEKKEKRLR